MLRATLYLVLLVSCAHALEKQGDLAGRIVTHERTTDSHRRVTDLHCDPSGTIPQSDDGSSPIDHAAMGDVHCAP